jgi:hypothetical protein
MKTLLLALALLLAPALAHTTLTNGGFETGDFTGWSTIGDAIVVDASIGVTPAGGSYQALISNAPPVFDRRFGSGSFNFSGNPSVATTIGGPLETFLELPLFSLTVFGGSIGSFGMTEGSAIKQSFTANAGDVLSV